MTTHLIATVALLLSTVMHVDAVTTNAASSDVVRVLPVLQKGIGGYAAYRIPGMVSYTTSSLISTEHPAGSKIILAFAEGRKYGCGDLEGQHDLVMARSVDGGATFPNATQPVVVINAATDISAVLGSNQSAVWDPTPVYDASTGAVHVIFAWCATPKDRLRGKNHVFLITSTDDGSSWSAPINLTSVTAPTGEFPGPTPGNGHGTMLQGGVYHGRLVVAMYGHSLQYPELGLASMTLTSDDHGKTWQLNKPCCPETAEPEVVQLYSNLSAVYFCIRSVARKMPGCGPRYSHCRETATSDNGGTSWTSNGHDIPALPDPNNKGSVHRLQSKRGLLFSNTASTTRRVNQTVYLSLDEGATWPYSVPIPVAVGGYSTLGTVAQHPTTALSTHGDDEAVALLFEVDTCTIALATFPASLFIL